MPLSNSPENKKRKFAWLGAQDIAHRGLHGSDGNPAENSLAAIRAATEAGYACEFDVRLTADERVLVFHDKDFGRMTGTPGLVADKSLNEAKALTFLTSGEHPPSLPEALAAVEGRVPLYIELKVDKDTPRERLLAGVRHALEGYGGPVALMSFDPKIIAMARDNFPHICRGLVVGDVSLDSIWKRLIAPFIMRRLHLDFVTCETTLLDHPLARHWRKSGGILLTWVIETDAQLAAFRSKADALTFDPPVRPNLPAPGD